MRGGILVLLGALIAPAQAQLSGLNRFEFQAGNTPYTHPRDLTTGFNQLNLRYDADAVQASVRVERFMTAAREKEYTALSQYQVSYRDRGFHARVGHFYESLGRGLLLRAFEIPGATYEDAAFRVRQSFQRDLEGLAVGYTVGRVSLKALRGRPLVNVLPPTLEEKQRRPDLIEAAESTVGTGLGRFGVSWLRHGLPDKNRDFAALSWDWNGVSGLSGYVEYAQRMGQGHPVMELGRKSQAALYAALSWARPGLGGSIEYKNYHHFFLGSGFNDPPSLVREHSWVLLNRATHVLNVLDERGFQAEAYGEVPIGGVLTLNVARAVNTFGMDFVFREVFGEYARSLGEAASARFFVDVAQDPLKAQSDRRTVGAYVDWLVTGRWSVSMDVQAQTFRRDFGENRTPSNQALSLTVSRSTRASAGLVLERSTDPFQTDDPATSTVETAARHWLGVNLGYRPNRRHTLALFLGTRRGGPACTSGICYEVLDFEGAEFRLTSRF